MLTARPASSTPTTTPTTIKPIDPEKEKLIRQILRTIGYDRLALQMIDQLIASLKQSAPNLPEEFWVKFRQKVKIEGLVDLVIPIYDKYYTKEDLQELLNFYNSPLGQKFITSLPQVTQESMRAGQAWGEKIGRDVMQEIKNENNK